MQAALQGASAAGGAVDAAPSSAAPLPGPTVVHKGEVYVGGDTIVRLRSHGRRKSDRPAATVQPETPTIDTSRATYNNPLGRE